MLLNFHIITESNKFGRKPNKQKKHQQRLPKIKSWNQDDQQAMKKSRKAQKRMMLQRNVPRIRKIRSRGPANLTLRCCWPKPFSRNIVKQPKLPPPISALSCCTMKKRTVLRNVKRNERRAKQRAVNRALQAAQMDEIIRHKLKNSLSKRP